MKKINVKSLVLLEEYVYYFNFIIQVYKSTYLLNNEYYALKENLKYKLYTYSKIYISRNKIMSKEKKIFI